jgi:predicted aconitase with swiveling domain
VTNRFGPEIVERELFGKVVIAGSASGNILRLSAPISFWGGIDPETGLVSDPRHPDFRKSIAGCVLAIPSTIGSSSSSAIMLELVRQGLAPAALVLGTVDAILVLGVIVGRELGYRALPVLQIDQSRLQTLPQDVNARIHDGGRITWTA